MNHVVFVGLGILDALAVLVLIMKLFKLPVWKYRHSIAGFVLFIACLSFMMRIVLGVPLADLPLQYLLFVLFFRYAVKIKVHLAAFIFGAGITVYVAMQTTLYFMYEYTGMMTAEVVQQSTGPLVNLLQISSIVVAYCIAYILFRCNVGFAFMPKPPHDFHTKENYFSDRNYVVVAGIAISVLTICLTLVLITLANPLGLLLVAVMNLAMLYYFSKRRETHAA